MDFAVARPASDVYPCLICRVETSEEKADRGGWGSGEKVVLCNERVSGRNNAFELVRDDKDVVDGCTEKTEGAHKEKQVPALGLSSPHPMQQQQPETSVSPARAISTVIVLA